MSKDIIIFDTNIWLQLFNTKKKSINYNQQYLNELRKNSKIGIFNISLIECLMRFKRKNNINKIKEIVSYIKDNNIYIGQISCSNFDSFPTDYNYILELDDDAITKEIDKLQDIRLCFKCSVISLWIECIIELFFIVIIDEKEDFDIVFQIASSKMKYIYSEIFNYFTQNELNDDKIKNNLCDIVNKIYKDIVFNIDKENFKFNKKIYNDLCDQIRNLKDFQSVSYIYRGAYKHKVMKIYSHRINSSLKELFDNELFTKIFHERLESFTQGEPLQRNDVEDMLMMSTLELDKYNQMTIVTKDKRMNNKLQKLNAQDSNKIYNKLFNIYQYK